MVISYYQPSPLKLTTEEEADTFQAVHTSSPYFLQPLQKDTFSDDTKGH